MLKIMQVGVGPIGQMVVSFIAGRNGLKLVAAVDPDPQKVGHDLGMLANLEKNLGVAVSANLEQALKQGKPDAAVLTTVSGFPQALEQIMPILEQGIPVVSTCEEMAYPWLTYPELAEKLDAAAKRNRVAVLGTGVNPGFLMDYLPLSLSAVCQHVDSVKVSRIQDATFRRIPFQQKIGAGLTQEEFEKKKQTGTLRHVGLTESMHMIAQRFKWTLDRTEDILSPIIADKLITSGYRPIQPGMAAGVQQIGRAFVNGVEKITLVFQAAVGQAGTADTVELKGRPDITSTIPGGVNGDVATCAITINAIRSIVEAEPGLRTMADCRPIAFFS